MVVEPCVHLLAGTAETVGREDKENTEGYAGRYEPDVGKSQTDKTCGFPQESFNRGIGYV